MAFKMIDREKWLVRADCQAFRRRISDKKRTGQAGSTRGGEEVNFPHRDPRVGERLFEQAGQVNEMIARCEFRDHPTELLMLRNLRRHFACP